LAAFQVWPLLASVVFLDFFSCSFSWPMLATIKAIVGYSKKMSHLEITLTFPPRWSRQDGKTSVQQSLEHGCDGTKAKWKG